VKPLYKRNRVVKEQGYEVVGIVWTREGNMWERHMLRRFRQSKTLDWSKLTHVDADDSDVCLHCLSQKVIYELAGEFIIYRCLSCEITFRFVEEHTPPPKPKLLSAPDQDEPPLPDDHD
jgi:hypothetical protein